MLFQLQSIFISYGCYQFKKRYNNYQLPQLLTLMNSRQKKIQAIRFALWNIRKTEITQIEFSLLGLIPLDALLEFIPMMRECLNVSKRDAHIGKYLVLFDLLLNHPPFNQLLHACLLQFYTSIVQHLLKQRLAGEIEQAKTVRKYWIRRIHPMLYGDLKNAVLRVSGIDVDHLLSADAVQHIRGYYTNVLRLSQQEIIYYLPQAALIPNHNQPPFVQTLNNHYYHTYHQPILPHPLQYQNTDQKGGADQFRKIKGTNYNPPIDRVKQNKVVHEQRQSREKLREKCDQISNVAEVSNDINVNTNSFYPQSRPLPDFTSGKRIRNQSQQTNISINDDIRQCQQPRKIRRIQAPPQPPTSRLQSTNNYKHSQKEPIKQVVLGEKTQKIENLGLANLQQDMKRVSQMLSKINIFNRYECKECGIRMENEEQMSQHREEHVKQRMEMFKKKEDHKFGKANMMKNTHFKTKEQWIGGKDNSQKIIHQMILDPVIPYNNPNIECAFCRDIIKRVFVKDNWKLQDAICTRIQVKSQNILKENTQNKENRDKDNNLNIPTNDNEKDVNYFLHTKCAQVLRTDSKTTQSWRMIFQ